MGKVPDDAYNKYKKFEKFLFDLFEAVGYEVKNGRNDCDMELIYNQPDQNQRYICEIKFSSRLYISPIAFSNGLKQLSKVSNNEKCLLIFNALCSAEYKERVSGSNIEIIDLGNLLYLVKNNNDLYQALLEILDFSIADVTLLKPSIPLLLESHNMIDNLEILSWKDKLNNIVAGRKESVAYENLCIDILKLLFSDYLSIWKKQEASNDGLYRFDLICKTKSDIKDDFFWTINNYFNTRYIVFDFKNYSEEITQKEIYTTEKYLYDKALRKVAIIISRKPFSKNAEKAAKGCLRENGKVIINLIDSDLIKMVELWDNGDNPADYLSEKLDALLVELEK